MSAKAMFMVALVAVAISGAWAQEEDIAYVPFKVNVNATAKAHLNNVQKAEKNIRTGNYRDTLVITSEGTSLASPNKALKPVIMHNSYGKISLELSRQLYKNANIALYSLSGKQLLHGRAVASETVKSISHPNVVMGIYLLSVKGINGNTFTTRITHSGGGMNIDVVFANENFSSVPLMKTIPGEWKITVSAEGYIDTSYTFTPETGRGNTPIQDITLRPVPVTPLEDFTETVGNVSFDMIYIPGGTFTIGCEKSSGCPADTDPVSGVTVSKYFIGKTEVSTSLWNTVMGTTCSGYNCSGSYTNMDWYDAMEFACKLSQKTGRKYRMTTEAEWEYAAKNHLSSLQQIGGGNGIMGEEWAYNSWNGTHAGGTDPVGPSSGAYTQKTRRDANVIPADNITGRLIRSIEGTGPALRLALSAEMAYPPEYVPPCDLPKPTLGAEPVNSYRDPRWITGSDAHWTTGSLAIGNFDLRVWEDGTARLGNTNGQWFTSNNIAFVFVPSSGSSIKFAYIFLDESQGSVISDKDFMNSGFVGRMEKKSASSVAKPTVSGLKSGAELAAAAGADYAMVDMVNIPPPARKQDSRLLDGTSHGWFQDNSGPGIGGQHHYRKDVDADEFRFTVNQLPNSRTILANGSWFTVNNTFLRITHSTGYICDYLYTVVGGTFYHNSFMAYERGDFRMFEKTANGGSYPCGDLCNGEIPKNQGVSFHASNGDKGKSTFVPAPCPSGGCQ